MTAGGAGSDVKWDGTSLSRGNSGRKSSETPADRLADKHWARADGDVLVALARSTVHWPLAFDWIGADPDPRLHLRRLSLLLSQRPGRTPTAGARRLGSLLSELRRGSGHSVITASAAAGIDPVALSLLEHGHLGDNELTTVLLERLAWGFHTTALHLASVLGRDDLLASRTSSGLDSHVEFIDLIGKVSHSVGAPTHLVTILGDTPSPKRALTDSIAGAILDRPIACSPVIIRGTDLFAAPTVRPDRRRRAGFAQVEVTVRDNDARAVADIEVGLALHAPSELPGLDPSATTDVTGVATLSDVWLPDLVRQTGEGMRLPIRA